MKLSQSLIKAWRDYESGEACGIRINAIYIDRTHRSPTSKAQLTGQCFEYWATGQKNYYGEIPEPETIKSGDLSADFKRARERSEWIKEQFKILGINILNVGVKVEADGLEGTLDIDAEIPAHLYENLLDIHAQSDTERVIIDLKYTGLIDDKWSDLGWDMEFLKNRPKLITQPIQYTAITGRPFIFWLVSSKKEMDSRMIGVNVSEGAIQSHIIEANAIRKKIATAKRFGITPRPSLAECAECPLNTECRHVQKTPDLKTIYL